MVQDQAGAVGAAVSILRFPLVTTVMVFA